MKCNIDIKGDPKKIMRGKMEKLSSDSVDAEIKRVEFSLNFVPLHSSLSTN